MTAPDQKPLTTGDRVEVRRMRPTGEAPAEEWMPAVIQYVDERQIIVVFSTGRIQAVQLQDVRRGR